jgi:biotin carboxyl carrier protein
VPLGAGWDSEPIGDPADAVAAIDATPPGQHRWRDWDPTAKGAASPSSAQTNGPAAAAATPEVEAEAASEPEPEPVTTQPAAPEPERAPAPAPAPANGAPHLMIRVSERGMVQAEMAGEVEPVILEDLTAYAEALVHAGGTAEILVSGNGGMGRLIATRAQRIMAEAGIEATIPD